MGEQKNIPRLSKKFSLAFNGTQIGIDRCGMTKDFGRLNNDSGTTV
jgi:hypothetical protein